MPVNRAVLSASVLLNYSYSLAPRFITPLCKATAGNSVHIRARVSFRIHLLAQASSTVCSQLDIHKSSLLQLQAFASTAVSFIISSLRFGGFSLCVPLCPLLYSFPPLPLLVRDSNLCVPPDLWITNHRYML